MNFSKLNEFIILLLVISILSCSEEESISEPNLSELIEGIYEPIAISKDGNTVLEWSNFGLNINRVSDSSLTYFAYNTPSDSLSKLLWPINGKFKIHDDKTTLIRHDGITLTTALSQNSLTLNFIMFPESMPCDTTFYDCIEGVCDTSIICLLGMLGNWNFHLKERSNFQE